MLLVPNTTNLPSVMTLLSDSYSSDYRNGVVSQLQSRMLTLSLGNYYSWFFT